MSEDKPKIPFNVLAANATEELRAEGLKQVTQDDFDHVYNRLGPMIWALAMDFSRENPSQARLNAVLNSLLTASLSWIVALTPEEGEDAAFDQVRTKFVENLNLMIADRDNIKETVSKLGTFDGKQMLLHHQNEVLAGAVMQLVQLMQPQAPEAPKEGE